MDSINYLGWESNFSLRPPRVFEILSKKFQWTQKIEKDLVERSANAIILGNNTKFLVNYLYVQGKTWAARKETLLLLACWIIITSLTCRSYQPSCNRLAH